MTISRRDRITDVSKRRVVYSDFDMDFNANPISLGIKMVTNEAAVGQSIKNIVLTRPGERFFNSKLSSKTAGLLFEPMHGLTEVALQETIINAIRSNEHRVNALDVIVNAEDDGAYGISITYSVTGGNTLSSLNFLLKRVR